MLLKGLVKWYTEINGPWNIGQNSSMAAQLTEYQKKDLKEAQNN